MLVDFYINTDRQYSSFLIGRTLNCTIQNIQIKTSTSSSKNLIKSSHSSSSCGGFVGYSQNSRFINLTIENTYIECNSRVGGIAGFSFSGGFLNFFFF